MKYGIQSGTYHVCNQENFTWNLTFGTGERAHEEDIWFECPFDEIPKVVVSLSAFDILHTANHRLRVKAKDVTRTGFKLIIETWGDTRVWSATASWLAYAS